MTVRAGDPNSRRFKLRMLWRRVRQGAARGLLRQPILVSTIIALGVAAVALVLVLDEQAKGRNRDSDLASTFVRIDTLRQAVRGSCRRLEAERERANVAEATLHYALSATPPGRARTRPRYGPNRGKRPDARDLADAAAYSPPANCAVAVESPLHYKPPDAIPYHELDPSFAGKLILAYVRDREQPRPHGVAPFIP